MKIISIITLLSITACGGFRSSGRRAADRDYARDCIKDLYNEGLTGELAIKACRDLVNAVP